jgi:hypothetical protein
MQWSLIQGKSRVCACSQKPFQPGDRVLSVLYKNALGEWERSDLLEAEKNHFNSEGVVLARWVHTFKDAGESTRIEGKAKLQSAETLFWSLVDEGSDLMEVRCLKQFLALWLERKKHLKPQGKRSLEGQFYLQASTGRQVWVDWVELTPQLLMDLKTIFDQWEV